MQLLGTSHRKIMREKELTSKCESEKRAAAYASVEGADSHAHSETDPDELLNLPVKKSQASIHFIMPNDQTIN